jgi:hypothetical protein
MELKINKRHLFGICLLMSTFCVNAEEPEYVDVPPPPARVESDDDTEQMEPEVTIIQRKDATVEEYRVNGLLYMIKITPVVGKSYYLVDKNGDGLMESKITQLYEDFRVPQWVLFSW